MESDQLISGGGSRYLQMRSESAVSPSSFLCRLSSFEPARIFDELPSATIVSVSRPDAGDISPVCKFLEVSMLSFSPEYGPKLKEDYVMVKHLPKILKDDSTRKCCACGWFNCCNDNWQKVWAVLKPGFLALLAHPFDTQPLDIIVFDVLPVSDGNGDGQVSLAKEIKERNPLRHAFKVSVTWALCFSGVISDAPDLESEPNSWEDTMKDELDRGKYPRMPWHDVHCALWGPPCRDVARHFVQRWNYAKRNKAPNEQAIPLLMPQHHMVIPHYMGRSQEMEIESKNANNHKEHKRTDSLSSISSCQDIPLLIPQEADGLDCPNEDTKLNVTDSPHDLLDQPSRVSNNLAFPFRKLKIAPVGPDTPMRGFVDDLDSLARHGKMASDGVAQPGMKDPEWWETQERGNKGGFTDESGQVGPCCSCRCQVIRSVSQWSAGTSQVEESIHNAYCSLIDKSEHFIYIESMLSDLFGYPARDFGITIFLTSFYFLPTSSQNQFFISGLSGDEIIRNRVLEALFRRIMRAYNDKKPFRVIIVIPLIPGFQGGMDDAGAASVRAVMHWQYRTICRGQNSILHNLNEILGPKMHDYISFYGLRSYGKLFEGGPVACSQVYVHSKIMIVDDCTTLIGSANINDRSLLGSRDSEIGLLIEDKEMINSVMGGKPWKAGKFSLSLRLSLWSEHLGIRATEMSQIIDPIVDSTYKDIWMATAKTNTAIYQDVFYCIPNDFIRSRAAFRQSIAFWKERIGHTTIDLGIAPDQIESFQNGDVKRANPMERLESVKGHLVSFPLDFMLKEDLRPVFNESEYYASPQVFH
ncbi:hypothetical protein DVH24_025457 [Malus domestica]|uniref:phospholipase D n=1 Tax=Malus domestica TaxID=3750 RepID=A0A498HKF3_MALDO|nr:hypothetical protein DVH24_025457 [Malus domestica]